MGKQKGQTATFRNSACADKTSNEYVHPADRGIRSGKITKVFSHGVRVQGEGYVNNNRILKVE